MSRATPRSEKGRALFHTRDSGGKHEMTPGQYVAWAARKAAELGVRFDGTPAMIESMIREGISHRGDIFLDYDVCGNQLQRPGLNQLIKVATSDPSASHIMIPRPDRLARPDEPIDAMKIETNLRRLGLTIIYMSKTLAPLAVGQRQDIGDQIVSLVDFTQAGEDRRDLAEKMIFAQLEAARIGCTVGGRPPYGFRRWLIRDDGLRIRTLQDGERVRMPGHHVFWLPVPDDHSEMIVVRRILLLLETTPANRIAAILTSEGVPTPNANRWRKDRGIRHETSGVWHANTITNIARCSLLVAVCTYGRRGLGDQLRFTPEGPRQLEESDYRSHDRRPKVITNPEANLVKAPAKFAPLVDVETHRNLIQKLDERGATQRGKPRSQHPDKNPLGGRTFDMNCGWLMYRTPHNGSFRYVCGLYQQSHGQKCTHNHVDGPLAAQFILAHLWESGVLSPRISLKVRERIAQLVTSQNFADSAPDACNALATQLSTVEADLVTVEKNLALAKSPSVFESVSKTFDQLKERKSCLEQRLSRRNCGSPAARP